MPLPNCSQQHGIGKIDRALKQRGRNELDSLGVGAKRGVSRNQGESDGINPQDKRPFLSDDVQQMIESLGIDRGKHRLVDRRDRSRMTTRKGDQILIGFLGSRNPFPQPRKRQVLKVDHAPHGDEHKAK